MLGSIQLHSLSAIGIGTRQALVKDRNDDFTKTFPLRIEHLNVSI